MRYILWSLLIGGAILRLWGIDFGLPAVFNADEPHHVNVAVSFGSGDLNPHIFKYPTLWMYTLAAFYGAYFLIWSGFGFLHSSKEFGELFVRDPSGFYLIARLLAAGFSLAAVHRIYRTAALFWSQRPAALAAALLAGAPILVSSSHAAKPESMMLFLASWSWWFAARFFMDSRRRDFYLAGFFAGLAGSTQYTALPLGILLPTVWAMKDRRDLKALALAVGAYLGGFVAGTPFAVIDFGAFRATVADMAFLEGLEGAAPVWPAVMKNIASFPGSGILGGICLIAGFHGFYKKRAREGVILLVPVLTQAACLSLSAEGGWQRYLFGVFPALALAGGIGAERLWRKALELKPFKGHDETVFALFLAGCFFPGAVLSAAFDRELVLPDTRTIASAWIERNIPPGAKILLDQEHASPRLVLSREHIEYMIERTKAMNHPRRRYYELMLSGHPGGGFAVYRLLRDAGDLHTLPGHAAVSAQGQRAIDASAGLGAARQEGIEYVVLTSEGANLDRSPYLKKFFDDVREQTRAVASFYPAAGMRRGPAIKICRIEGGSAK